MIIADICRQRCYKLKYSLGQSAITLVTGGQTKTQISEDYESTLICRRIVLHLSVFEIRNDIAHCTKNESHQSSISGYLF